MGHKTERPREQSLKVPTDPHALTPLELQAVMIAAKPAKGRRSQLQPGKDQAVDVTLRLTGLIDVGDDQTAITSTKPEAEALLAVVFAHLGAATRRKVYQALIEVYPGREAVELDAEAEHLAKAAVGLLTIQRESDRSGNVTGKVIAHVVRRGKRLET